MERRATGSWVQGANGFGEISLRLLSGSPRTRRERKPNESAIAAGRGGPRGGYRRLNLVQFSSIWFGFRWKQAFRGGAVAVLGTDAKDLGNALRFLCLEAQIELLTDGEGEAGDFAVARHRGLRERSIVSMRGNDNRNASRLKSYGRF